ncbi:KRFA protein, partial [Neodrepanis coruscans]|nr:KRFA protein [Neodrepanis coruscans]
MFSRSQTISSRCLPRCDLPCPQPLANAWNQPCVTSCGDSRAVIYPPPVAITFPGPILSSCPQQSVVGSSAPSAFGSFLGSLSPSSSRTSCSSHGSSAHGFGSCRPR